MRRVKSQFRKRATAGNTSRDHGWRQFLDANQLWVEIASDVNGEPGTIGVRAPDPVAHQVAHEVRAIELSIARREEEREIARAIGAREVVLLLN